MSSRWLAAALCTWAIALGSVCTVTLSAGQQRANTSPHGIGTPASPADFAAADLTIFADGRGLPAGRGTAREGRTIYAARCAACHGPRGEGTANFPQLVGGAGSLKTDAPVLTVGSYWPYATTLWDYTRRAMPYQEPGTLTPSDVYAVTAYLLYMNGIVSEDAMLDPRTLPAVRMPNRDGFIADQRPDVKP
jgi:S-disulfanyl-L-cysteine oxidoreductase SoxD